jgi:hypothetical protein
METMATTAAPTEFHPLPTTREERGRQIAKLGGIRQLGGRYVVPSQSANSNVPTYLVDVVEQTCTCPDYELRRVVCKHQEAVLFWLAWESAVNAETGEVALPAKLRRKTYRQDWRSYEAAQTTERERVPQLLHSLCKTVEEAEREPGRPGRKPIPRREAIYAIATKVYSLCSGRRAEPDIKAAVDRGHLSRVWDPNTLFRVMEDPTLTPVLVRLIMESSNRRRRSRASRGSRAASTRRTRPASRRCSTSAGSTRSTASSARSMRG